MSVLYIKRSGAGSENWIKLGFGVAPLIVATEPCGTSRASASSRGRRAGKLMRTRDRCSDEQCHKR